MLKLNSLNTIQPRAKDDDKLPDVAVRDNNNNKIIVNKPESAMTRSSSGTTMYGVGDSSTSLRKNMSNISFAKVNSSEQQVPFLLNSKKFYQPRPSIVSRQSIELFLEQFPKNELAYANDQLFRTVKELASSDIRLNKSMTFRQKTRAVINSHKFHLFFILLVIFDCICVVLQMILDTIHKDIIIHKPVNQTEECLILLKSPSVSKSASSSSSASKETHPNHHGNLLYYIEEVAEIFGLLILSLFIVSIVVHAFTIPKIYFKSKLEMFDALIVIISFILEIVSVVKKDSVKEVEAMVITFRFWRIIRIVNAIVVTVEKRVYEKLDKLKEDIKNVLDDNIRMESELNNRTSEIENLLANLQERNAEFYNLKKQCHSLKLELDKNTNSRVSTNSTTSDRQTPIKMTQL